MTQNTTNTKMYTADEGKVFQRIHNGFTTIEKPYIVGTTIILGQILSKKLAAPIDDKIEYYEEIDAPIEETTDETPVEESNETNNEENA